MEEQTPTGQAKSNLFISALGTIVLIWDCRRRHVAKLHTTELSCRGSRLVHPAVILRDPTVPGRTLSRTGKALVYVPEGWGWEWELGVGRDDTSLLHFHLKHTEGALPLT